MVHGGEIRDEIDTLIPYSLSRDPDEHICRFGDINV